MATGSSGWKEAGLLLVVARAAAARAAAGFLARPERVGSGAALVSALVTEGLV